MPRTVIVTLTDEQGTVLDREPVVLPDGHTGNLEVRDRFVGEDPYWPGYRVQHADLAAGKAKV